MSEHAMDKVERRRVVVVEDDQDTRDVLIELLVLLGHDAAGVADGAAAITAYTELRPDVMLIDLQLPDMDGYEVAKRIRQVSSRDPSLLVALTGRSQPADIARSFQAGMKLHIVKPVGMYVLKTIVGDTVRGHQPTRWPAGSGVWSPAELRRDDGG